MNIIEAQADARRAFANGAVGVAVSGTIWILSGVIALGGNMKIAMLALFFGGMTINTLSSFIETKLFKLCAADKENKLIWLGLQTVPVILLGMLAGFLLAPSNQVAFFAFTSMAIGARYLSFQTLYGMMHYVLLGFTLLALGFAAVWLGWTSAAGLALAVGAIEISFALIIARARPFSK